MHNIPPTDHGRNVDWSATSEDYARHRPGFPQSFFAKLDALGIGTSGQRILDLGTGTGTLARTFARSGCAVTGVDIAQGQIARARALAEREELTVDFRVAPAEETKLADDSFDVISAAQCWLYFDKTRIITEVRRMLAPTGKLLTCHICWLPRLDETARRSEQLVLKHNPDWSAADWDGEVPAMPDWAVGAFRLAGMFYYDEALPFTREGWGGRLRACRGIGATLAEEQVAEFDSDHQRLLAESLPESFTVLHRIDAHIFEPLS